MGIVNRRNAVVGWAVWQVAKRLASRQAKAAVPAGQSGKRRPYKSAIIATLAAVGAVLMFRRRKSGDELTTDDALPPLE